MSNTRVLLLIAIISRVITLTIGTFLGIVFSINLGIVYFYSQDAMVELEKFLLVSVSGVYMISITGILTIGTEIIACCHKRTNQKPPETNDDLMTLHGLIVGAAVFVGLWGGIFLFYLYVFSRVVTEHHEVLSSTFTVEGTLGAGLLLGIVIGLILLLPRTEVSARKVLLYTAPRPPRQPRRIEQHQQAAEQIPMVVVRHRAVPANVNAEEFV